MKPAIAVDSLSKRYRLGAQQQGSYRTLRESLSDAALAPWRRFRRLLGQPGGAENGDGAAEFWALKDVSLEVRPGEVLGVIGPNGAGKSTFFKILGRITEPTTGRAELRGRVGSLLEVGTGFHPELTGRENIFLNGSILGMSRREIARKFDDIVAFAEVEQFLDTPVKRFSSGMYVRLAFAVASHLEPEVLLVDEVLAVGDQAFQKKCLGKMNEVSRSGRTVLFVSHNMATILNLCSRVAVFNHGRLVFAGDCRQGVEWYMQSAVKSSGGVVDLAEHPNRRPGSKVVFHSLEMLDHNGNPGDCFFCGEPVSFAFRVAPFNGVRDLRFGAVVEDAFGSRLFTVSTALTTSTLPRIDGPTRVVCSLKDLPLVPGRYALTLNGGPFCQADCDVIPQAAWFDVIEADYYGNGRPPHPSNGRFLVRSLWHVEEE